MESFPSLPAYSMQHGLQPEIQRMRILVGSPLRRPPKHQILEDGLVPMFPALDPTCIDLKLKQNMALEEEKFIRPDGLSDFVVYCTTDFSTVSKEVHVRTRRVRLIGLEVLYAITLLRYLNP